MSEQAEAAAPHYDVLNFFRDSADDCAVTVLTNGVRFHVVAEKSRLSGRTAAAKKLSRQYSRLLRRVQRVEEEVDGEGNTDEDDDSEGENNDEPAEFSDGTRDSGIDVSSTKKPRSSSSQDPYEALQRWMLSSLGELMAKQAPKQDRKKPMTVQEWYHGASHFYHLEIRDDELLATEDMPTASLEKSLTRLIPSMPLPKYLQKLQMHMYSADHVTVLATSTEKLPIHPARVRVDGDDKTEYFLKLVDNTQHMPTKREIRLLKQIEHQKLHESFRMPLLRGLVYSPDNNSAIMGFLMDMIPEATPLTQMLDSKVAQEKRDGWASEAKRIVDLLHEHGIVWGDAKGDNFMVDADDNLWIIDFGGSYTEGWIDPELNETEEGDNMGVERLTNGLHDPEAGTVEGQRELEAKTTEPNAPSEDTASKAKGRKRKASRDEDEDAEYTPSDDEPASKQPKKK